MPQSCTLRCSDGTHSFTAGDFLYETGSSVSTTATDVYNHLRDQLDTTAGNFITQAVTNGSGWVTVNFEDLPVSPTIINGLEVVTGFHSAGTAGNNIQLVLTLGASSDTIFQADFSETTLLFPSRHRSVRPTGGDWTESDVNNTYVRLGMSSDANPDIHCDGIRWEVDTAYAPTIALNTADAHSFSTTTPTVEFTGSDSDGDTLSYDVRIRTKTRDDYLEDNQDSFYAVGDPATRTAVGQPFHGWTGQLTYASFYLKSNAGSPSGNMTAKLYALSGSFGSTSGPTGSALATSTAINANTLTGSYAWTHFNFGSPYTLSSGTDYVIVVEF